MKLSLINRAYQGAFKRGGGYKTNFNGRRNPNFTPGRRAGRDDDDTEYLGRTRGKKITGDGCMGSLPYQIDTEGIQSLKWTDLVDESADSDQAPQGLSSIRTEELANRRLLSLPLVNSLIHNRKYEFLTPVQAQTVLPILRGESVVVRAKTGTGKTAAFAIPILQKVLEAKTESENSGKVSALIVSPTRELAQQIADEMFKITQFGGLYHIRIQSLVGGIHKDRQLRAAGLDNGAMASKVSDVIVATPGRLRDVLDDPEIASRFSELKVRVFDEADRILDIGFEQEMEQIREIIDEATGGKEIPLLMFSATADQTMREFARRQFGDKVKVVDTVPKDEPTANELVNQSAISCSNWADLYESASENIVGGYEEAQKDGGAFKAIVFLPTTVMVDQYERALKSLFGRGSAITPFIMGIHGQRRQQSRQVRSDKFRKEKNAILITTDVVARGMDFPSVSHVYQLGPPPDVSSYIHRIGRTARIGNSGKSVLFYTKHLRGFVDALAREKIKPNLSVFQSNPKFKAELEAAFLKSLADEEEAEELVRSLMSYMTVLKSKFSINAREFLQDMQPFVELIGLERLNLAGQQRSAWNDDQRRNRRSGYGSSRRTRMQW